MGSVRLCNQADRISQILEHYDHLDEEIRAELPLKRIWMVAAQEDVRRAPTTRAGGDSHPGEVERRIPPGSAA